MIMTSPSQEIDEDTYIYLLDIERNWRRERKRLKPKELLATFPNALPSIRDKLREWEKKRDDFLHALKKKLSLIQKQSDDPFSQWFWREWIKLTDGKELLGAERHVSRLRRLVRLAEGKKLPKGWVGEDAKEMARSVPIESLLETPYRTYGNRVTALCPFHEEKTPSFVIYTDTNRYWCFGCSQGGDVIHYVQSLHNLSFKETIEYLT